MSKRAVVWIEDMTGNEECPECGRDFSKDMDTDWEKIDGYHYRSGGMTLYGCPGDGCEGEIQVTI